MSLNPKDKAQAAALELVKNYTMFIKQLKNEGMTKEDIDRAMLISSTVINGIAGNVGKDLSYNMNAVFGEYYKEKLK